MDDEDIGKLIGCAGLVVVGVVLFVVFGNCAGCAISPFTWFAGCAVDVAKEELDPRVLVDRYNWFKDAAAQLDKKQADIKVYDVRFNTLEKAYTGKQRTDWARDDREQWAIWASEAAGVRASYNQLASEYNANMAKEQWRFCEIGKLPPGASTPLPREYKPYEEK